VMAGGMALMLLAILFQAGCGEQNVYTPPPPPQVTVTQPVRQQVTGYLEFTGNTQAPNTVQLRARVAGYLDKVYFNDGEPVKKGQLLFLIQQNTYEAKLKQAEGLVLSQKARLFHAKTELGRYTKLVQQKAAAQTDVDNWRYQRDDAQATLITAEAQRDLAKLDLGYTKVTAPFNGRIDRRLRDPGNLVGAGENTLLAEINQIDPIYVYFTINEADLLQVMAKTKKPPEEAKKSRMPLSLGLANEEGFPHRGYLDFAAISVTPTTGTLQLRGIFPNPDFKILPGLFARIKGPVVGSEKESLLVPEVAIGNDQLGSYVLVADDKNLVQRRGVKVGAKVGDRRAVEEGLSGNEAVIVSGLLRAIPGQPVTPVKEGQAAPPTPNDPSPKTASGKNGK